MKSASFEDLRVYRAAEAIGDLVWEVVSTWDHFARETIGRQLTRSADSIGANIAEGYGRQSYADNKRFVAIARGSLMETRHWLRRAHKRGLLPQDQTTALQTLLEPLPKSLNAYLKSIGPIKTPNDQ